MLNSSKVIRFEWSKIKEDLIHCKINRHIVVIQHTKVSVPNDMFLQAPEFRVNITDRNFVDNFLQVVIYLALVANI